jgi:hypothetical protein
LKKAAAVVPLEVNEQLETDSRDEPYQPPKMKPARRVRRKKLRVEKDDRGPITGQPIKRARAGLFVPILAIRRQNRR